MKEQLVNLFYMAEEYKHFEIEEYKEVYDYISELVNNIDSIEDLDVKKYLLNWKYKDLVYKTLQFNSLWIPANDRMFLNALTLLRIREYTKYENYCSGCLNLHIIFDSSKFPYLIIKELQKVDAMNNFFKEKYIHIYNGEYFEGELFEYLVNNDYNIIYEIDNIKQVQSGTYNIRYCVDEQNIGELDSIIQKHISNNGKKCFIHIKKENSSEFRNKARKAIEEMLFKYSTRFYLIVAEDFLPTQNVQIDFEHKLSIKDNIKDLYTTIYNTNDNIDDIISTWKKELISHSYFDDKCMNCDEKILCMLGVSDIDCDEKIL